MSDKQDALIEVVDLITRHGLTIDEVSAALKGEPAFKAARSGGILSRLFAYIGAERCVADHPPQTHAHVAIGHS